MTTMSILQGRTEGFNSIDFLWKTTQAIRGAAATEPVSA